MNRHSACALTLILLWFTPTLGAPDTAPPAPPPEESRAAVEATTPTLSPENIRRGMAGYGLTVFAGTDIEPFPVEVVSVMSHFGPQRAVIWIRCPGERMQKSGPVQGMSGSPIYLWDEDEPKELGKGGRLIGAFAYGYNGTKDCYAGVQPIGLMREAAGRAHQVAAADIPNGTHAGHAVGSLRTLLRQPAVTESPEGTSWRAAAVLRLLESQLPEDATPRPANHDGPEVMGTHPVPLGLPMTVGSGNAARLLAPMLKPLGINPVAMPASGVPIGSPPPGLDTDSIRLAPGSVLSIPLAYGDLDVSAQGTVTEVLPGGRVTAFGHAMFAQGATALPMATGYVHMVMPSLFSSFKLGGSAAIQGTIYRDEHSAVVGLPGEAYSLSPVKVVVNMPEQPSRAYNYQLAQHPGLTPYIGTLLVIQSLSAVTTLPSINTTHLSGELNFTGGRVLNLDSVFANGGEIDVVIEVLPALITMMQNAHEPVMLESMKLVIDVEPKRRSGTLIQAQLEHNHASPGDILAVRVRIKPHGEAPIERRIEVSLPDDLLDGTYELMVCDARHYTRLLIDSHPHLLVTRDAGDLRDAIQRILDVRADELYVVLQPPHTSIAVGRREMPTLPSSRRAMIEASTGTGPLAYYDWIEKQVPCNMVIKGAANFMVDISRYRGVDD